MMIIHYEVYVQEPRGWMLHARHPRQERETALAEAKELEQLNLKVRIVREAYYTDSNKFEESDIYLTGRQVEEKYRGSAPSNLQSRPSPKAAKSAPLRKPAAKPASKAAGKRAPMLAPGAGAVIARLLAILAVALAMAVGAVRVTPDVILILWRWGMPMDLQEGNYSRLLFAIFTITFLIVAVPLCMRFLPRNARLGLKLKPGAAQAPQMSPAEAQALQAEADREAELRRSLDKLAAQALREEAAGRGHDEEAEEEPEAVEEAAEAEEELPEIRPDPADDDLPEIRPDPEDEAAAPATEPPTEAPAPVPAKVEARPTVSVAAESHRSSVSRFLDGAIAAVKAAAANLDNYNKFALHLYLAGGVDSLCEAKGLGAKDRAQLTAGALEALGTSPELARKFHGKLDEYLMEPQYMRMLQAGRNAMDGFIDGRESEAHGELKSAIRDWNKPAEKKVQIITVMFTDMVGSTDLTQAKGDMAAQEVVRRHNSIVRTAIAQNGGREIKHTGDGIMASFASAAGAVEAAVVIQRNVAAHNTRVGDQSLRLRIGLNAGEPIQEEDDLFGTTVQLSARVCAATATDQILCTGVVKDLSLGKGGTFKPAGSHALKGFRDKIDLFEVVWRS